jgi:hypothetical protein
MDASSKAEELHPAFKDLSVIGQPEQFPSKAEDRGQ